MPGRLTITASEEGISQRFNVKVSDEYNPRYNISPTQRIAVILNNSPDEATFARWGVKTKWFPHPLINARSEGIEKNRVFSKAFLQRRCLILADSYYEWQPTPEGKIPYRIMLKDESVFAIAGVYEIIDGEVYVATITTAPNSLVGKIHERMPAILRKEDERRWLETPDKTLLKPYNPKEMMLYRVTTDVNSSKHDRKEYVEQQGKKVYG